MHIIVQEMDQRHFVRCCLFELNSYHPFDTDLLIFPKRLLNFITLSLIVLFFSVFLQMLISIQNKMFPNYFGQIAEHTYLECTFSAVFQQACNQQKCAHKNCCLYGNIEPYRSVCERKSEKRETGFIEKQILQLQLFDLIIDCDCKEIIFIT